MQPEPHARSSSESSAGAASWSPWVLGACAVALVVVGVVVLGAGVLHGWEYKKELSGGYTLLAVDVREQMDVSMMLPNGDAIGVIPATVIAVGWNKDFIIAQQRTPARQDSGGARATHFYLLRVSDGEVRGPLTAEQFQAERVVQAVPSELDFTLTFKDLQ